MSTERKNHSAHTVCDEPVFRKRCASRTLRDLEKQPNFLKEKQNNMIPNFIRYLSGKFHWPMPLGSPMVARMPDRDHIQKPPFFEKYWDYVHRSLLRLSGSYTLMIVASNFNPSRDPILASKAMIALRYRCGGMHLGNTRGSL
jgi:hypothetical protein